MASEEPNWVERRYLERLMLQEAAPTLWKKLGAALEAARDSFNQRFTSSKEGWLELQAVNGNEILAIRSLRAKNALGSEPVAARGLIKFDEEHLTVSIERSVEPFSPGLLPVDNPVKSHAITIICEEGLVSFERNLTVDQVSKLFLAPVLFPGDHKYLEI